MGYHTSALAVREQVPGIKILPLPDRIRVETQYVLTRLLSAKDSADQVAAFLLSRTAKDLLAAFGFRPATEFF